MMHEPERNGRIEQGSCIDNRLAAHEAHDDILLYESYTRSFMCKRGTGIDAGKVELHVGSRAFEEPFETKVSTRDIEHLPWLKELDNPFPARPSLLPRCRKRFMVSTVESVVQLNERLYRVVGHEGIVRDSAW